LICISEGVFSLSNRMVRFELVAKSIARSIIRNRHPDEGGSGCPILVEGIRDEGALRELGFSGIIEKVNRGWDRSRLIAFLFEEYCKIPAPDGGPSLIVLMDWDRTGGRLQSSIRERLMSLDIPVDEDLRGVLSRAFKPEGRTVESLLPHSSSLLEIIQTELSGY